MKRQPQSFLITLLQDEADPQVLCGRLRTITTDEEYYFRGVTELVRILSENVTGYGENIKTGDQPQDEDFER